MIVGLEVRDTGVAALTVSDNGEIVARASNSQAEALGIAVTDTHDPSCSEAVAAAAGASGVKAPPRLINRGVAMALGEQWVGAARGATHVMALCIWDRVHGGIVLDGRPFEGGHGLAGAAGWLALNPVEREDYRKLGCLEAEIGASGIVRRLVWRLKAGDTSRVHDIAGGDMGAITVQQIFEAARSNDGVAISVVRDTAKYIGMAIGNVAAMIDPEVVVLGGLIAEASDLMLDPACAEATRRMPPSMAGAVQIAVAALGADAAALGAARAAMLAA